jgi:DNA-binding transcriptional regulator YbjK
MHRKYARVASTPTNKTVRRTPYQKTKERKDSCIKNKTATKRAIVIECRI